MEWNRLRTFIEIIKYYFQFQFQLKSSMATIWIALSMKMGDFVYIVCLV